MSRQSKSEYVTLRNLPEKTRRWVTALEPYVRPHRTASFPLRPENAALIVVDPQKFFFDFESPAYLPASAAILENLTALKAAFRRRNRPVFLTRQAPLSEQASGLMSRWWKAPLLEGDPLAGIGEDLRPHGSDVVVTKSRYSAFLGTGLESLLHSAHIGQVVVAGVLTHLCCESTARDAFQRDFEVVIVLDATASRTEELHLGSLKALADGFARPMTTREVLACLE